MKFLSYTLSLLTGMTIISCAHASCYEDMSREFARAEVQKKAEITRDAHNYGAMYDSQARLNQLRHSVINL